MRPTIITADPGVEEMLKTLADLDEIIAELLEREEANEGGATE